MAHHSFLVFLSLLITISLKPAQPLEPTVESSSPPEKDSNKHSSTCTVYISPSTIPGAGLGIFTSVDLSNGTVIGTSDVTIPILDLNWHHPVEEEGLYFWILSEYVWDGKKMCGMYSETDQEIIDAYVPGLDCAVNCHLGLINVDRGLPSYDTRYLPHRSQYPAAGSMTAYWNTDTFATTEIPAGAELFKFYGDHWFSTRPDNFGTIPLTKDFKRAETLLLRMDQLLRGRLKLNDTIMRDFYSIAISYDSRILNALPREYNEVPQALEGGLGSVLQGKFMRPNVQDMPEARCLESIVAGPSSIEGAGRGGFAVRKFAEGEIITGSPLLHIPDKRRLDMYLWDEIRGVKDKSVIVGHQILMNYCWGHEESSLLLCPYGSGVNYINHSREQPNVVIRWAPHGHVGQDDTRLEWSLHSLGNAYQPRLAWDYVALRDVEEGEELFMDYGDAWTAAWEQHKASWQPSEDVDYKPAAEWNEILRHEDIRTEIEQEDAPYPENIELVCHKKIQINVHVMAQKLDEHEDDVWDMSMEGIPCRIIHRSINDEGATVYSVLIMARTGQYRMLERNNIHRKWIRFRDTKYSTDMHLPDAFRKEATIPDTMFPPAWRNKRYRLHHEEL